MDLFGHQPARPMRAARSAALILVLCLFAVLSIGTGAGTCRHLSSSASADAGITPYGAGPSPTQLATACDGLTSDAVLTDRRRLALVSTSAQRLRQPTDSLPRFHSCRPKTLRTKAVYCNFFCLRSILHPQLALISHTSMVLC